MMMYTFVLLFSIAFASQLDQQMVDMTHAFDEPTFNYPAMKLKKNGMHKNGHWIDFEELSVGTYIISPSLISESGTTVDKLPLSHLIAPAAVVDITATAKYDPDAGATVEDLLYWEALTGQTLNESILLLKSGWGRKWNDQPAFFGMEADDPTKLHYPGLAAEAAEWLVENRKVYGIGVETPSVDSGSSKTGKTQELLLSHGVFIIVNMANMDKISIYGATVHAMPMKLAKASTAPVRVVALYPVVLFDYIPAAGSDKRF